MSRPFADLVAEARETKDPDALIALHQEAAGLGCGDDFVLQVASDCIDAGEGVEAAEEPGPDTARVEVLPDSDRVTEWLRRIPWAGERLVKGREAFEFLRFENSDTRGIRSVKLAGKGVVIVALGGSGYLMVAEPKYTR